MTAYEHNYQIKTIRITCAANQLYHQDMESLCEAWDRGIRIAVMVLAVIGLTFAVPDLANAWIGFGAAIASLVGAAVLNIVQVGDWAKRHGELFRLWSDLRGDADREQLKTCEVDDADKVPLARSERLDELCGKVAKLNADQKSARKKLFARCCDDAHRQIGVDVCQPTSPPPASPVHAASVAEAAV